MLTLEENELLTRTGPGTPMGELMRRYWLPAVLSWELPEPDCPPVRVKLLGEALVMFRDTEGRIGLLDEFCAHRGTSLWLGRNEQSGLRCVWHGWKYDVNGQCVDQLNERGGTSFAQKIRIKSYPTLELGGVIWAYMGPPEKRPPPPRFGWTQVPETHRHALKVIQECNWLQGLEGGLDQSHVGILHSTFRVDPNNPGSTPTSFHARGGAPIFDIEPTKFGHRYVAIRPLGQEQVYVRGYNFVMPSPRSDPTARRAKRTPRKNLTLGTCGFPSTTRTARFGTGCIAGEKSR
jgi:nitrite reductase/ring-hydroxylating ferredoxin subunit